MPSVSATLAQAVGSWLHFEYALGRNGLFSERHLTVPVSQALQYRYKCGIAAEHKHEAIKGVHGQPPRVDFAALENFTKVKAVVETKWTNHANISRRSIVWDLLRLELVANADNAHAFFLLAGERSMLANVAKLQWGRRDQMGPLLQLKRESNIEIRAPAPQLRDKLTEKFERYPNVTFASEIRLKVPYAYPDNSASEQSSLSKYQVLVWEIDRTIKIPRFTPHNNKLAA